MTQVENKKFWWIEIYTIKPRCLYYFGPFETASEAQMHKSGYLEDLSAEQAEIGSVEIKQCEPKILTQEW